MLTKPMSISSLFRQLTKAVLAFTCLTYGVAFANPPAGYNPTVTSGGGGSGAPTDAQYVTLTNNASLTNERTLAVTAPLTKTDNGANNSIMLDITNSLAGGLTGGTDQQTAVDSILGFAGVAAGDFVYYDGANWSRFAKGTDGDYLQMTAGAPVWQAATAGAGTGVAFVTVGSDATLSAERAITAGTGILGTDGGANSTYTLAVDTTLVATTSNSLTFTNKTLTDGIMSWNAGNGFRLNNSAAVASRLKWADFAAARLLRIPDPGTDADFVMTEGAQTINGVKTFGSAPVLSTGTITVGGQTITLPSTTDTIVTLAASQTLTNKTLTSPHIGSSLVLDQSTANYTLTWANPAAARALRIQDMGVDADVLMKAQSQAMTAGGVLYGDGTKVAVTAAGTSGQFLKSNGTVPVWGSAGIFGGSGIDGAVTISSNTTKSTVFQYNATTFQINNSCQLDLQCDSVINASSSVTIGQGSSGAIRVLPKYIGGLTNLAQNGQGPQAGSADGSRTTGYGGGGGANYGAGGDGGGPGATVPRGGYVVNGTINSCGSGGGAGSGPNGGAGGYGGGRLTICAADVITIAAGATITAESIIVGAVATGSSGGGGGGAGGTVFLASQTGITNSGTIFVRGSVGGNGAGTGGGGGGGGGGLVVFWSPTNTVGTVTATGGVHGTGGTTTATNGAAGNSMQIVGSPNLPLLGWVEQHLDSIPKQTTTREVAQIAANGDLAKYLAYKSGSLSIECEAIGDCEVLQNAA
jgi:hypothetical protein